MMLRPIRGSHRAMTSFLLLLALFVASPAPAQAQMRKELRVGVVGLPVQVDLATAMDGAAPLVARQVFDTLVAFRDGSTEVDPALALRWSVSRDALVWTFTLREGVRFHDGTPVTGAEVAVSFQRQLAPDAQGVVWPALMRGRPGVIKDVRAPDARTVDRKSTRLNSSHSQISYAVFCLKKKKKKKKDT